MMKKIMWIISFIPLAGTAAVIAGLPERIPMHYDFAGNIDRWGSKYESFIFPVIILLLSLFWTLLAGYYEKKALMTKDEKESAGAGSNARVLCIAGACMAALFTVMHGFSLYRAYKLAASSDAPQAFDIGKLTAILLGVVFIVLGNFMPKTRINSTVGARTKWSMYNDNTWRKSNRFGAVVMMATGALTIVTAVFLKSTVGAVFAAAGYIILAAVITTVYSRKVYIQELAAEKKADAL